MGVHGLWKLIEPAGKPVPLESLENKVLAVDVSIWLYQVTKGLQTTGGGAVPNAHLLGLFNRICKLLYYRIKPVFVFDGGVPLLKKETIEARKRLKRKAQDTSEQLREKLLTNYLKQKAIHDILGSDDGPSTSQVIDDMYVLPPLPEEDEERIDDPDSSDMDTEVKTAKCESFCNFLYAKDLHSIDVHSEQFKTLPAEIRHELLSELIETKKQNSWAKIHEMPEDSQDFSKFQLERLKKRRDVQLSLDSAVKEMGGRSMTLSELEAMFKEDGIVTDNLTGRRIVGDNVTRFLYVTGKSKEKDVKETQKASGKKENVSIKDKRAEIEKIFKNTVPENSTPINESKFQDKIQTIEDGIFIKDLSSDDEPEVINDTTDSEYIRSLLDKEKLSQVEILKIIKQEQNDEDSKAIKQEPNSDEDSKVIEQKSKDDKDSSPFMIMSDRDNETTNASHPVVISDESVSNEIPLDEIIQPSQEYQQSKLSILIDRSVKVTSKIVDIEKYENSKNKTFPKENEVSKSHSIELFFDDVETNDEFQHSDHLDDLPQTVILSKNDNECQGDNVPNPKSLQLCSDTDSDDFIEVSDEKRSSYFKRDEKQIEISFNPGEILENDIFSDIFDQEKINDTVVLEKSRHDPFTSYQQLNDTVIFEKSLNNIAISPNTLDDTVILENGIFPNENLNFISPLSDDMSNLTTENTSTQKDIPIQENEVPSKANEEIKAVEPAKTLATILSKVKKAETAVKNTKEMKTDLPSENDAKKREFAKEIRELLNKEQSELLAERERQERLGCSITQQMIIEAQELLQLFGLPYVVAPMEAEAQCAFLDKISLTEGTITDDSDIWLFGGQKVYKNFFDNKKFVLQFRAVDIEHFFKLSREQLIQMAMLVGSDYTVGIEGIGPVTAIEILAYFSDLANKPTSTDTIAETLRKFRTWLSSNRNKTSYLSKKCKDVSLTEAFPNTTVIDAYLYPTVDESKEGFTWATPDLDQIRSYMHSKFGWKNSKIDDIILPVMKRLNDKNKQSTLDMYFKQKAFSSIEFGGVSKRVIQAINVMKSKTDEQPFQKPSTSKSPKKTAPKTPSKKNRKNSQKTPLKRTPTALPVQISSQNSANKKVAAPYFAEVILQKEKDKMEAAKRKLEAIKVFRAQNKSNRGKNAKKRKVLPPKRDSSYLSESSSGDEV